LGLGLGDLLGEYIPSANADGHSWLTAQLSHLGRSGEHTVCPNPTSSGLMPLCVSPPHTPALSARAFQHREGEGNYAGMGLHDHITIRSPRSKLQQREPTGAFFCSQGRVGTQLMQQWLGDTLAVTHGQRERTHW
jgi:hypothetical protein